MKRVILVSSFVLIFVIATSLFAISADQYEDDDSFQNATLIPTNGSRQTHNFHDTGDIDFINFTAEAGAVYIIQTHLITSSSITDTNITLLDTDGATQLATNDDIVGGVIRSSRMIWQATGTGTYYVKIHEYYSTTDGEYEITITKLGDLVPTFTNPLGNINVKRNGIFNMTVQLTCFNGTCMNITAYLDPQKKGSKVEEDVLEVLKSKGEVDVIVEVKEDAQKGKEVVNTLRKEKGIFTQPELTLKRQYKYANAFAGKVSKKGLEKLEKHSDVITIALDRTYSISLTSSIPVINADNVWPIQYNGQNLTGKGETICIIDTGINYTHPDFGACSFTSNLNDGSCPKVLGGYDFVNNDNNPMDDHSHGTHVAGIAASNDTTYRGVAPGANLIAIKALGASGSGSTSDIIAGIEWCTDNQDLYNISVISMSLGASGTQYNEHCNSVTEATTINAAVAAGIIVMVASGNEGYTGGISLPACVENATSVGAINDGGTFFYNRGVILDLIAPGVSITATDYTGTHATYSGTSMATPHASGVAALVAQYGKLRLGKNITAQEIKHIMRYNAENLFDSGTNLRFPRIDAYKSTQVKGIIPTTIGATPFYTLNTNPSNVTCLDWLLDGETCNITWSVNATGADNTTWEFFAIYETNYRYNTTEKINITIIASEVTLDTPSNGTIGNPNITLNCSASSAPGLSNLTLYTDITGNWTANTTITTTGTENITNITLKNLPDGDYIWNCLAKNINNTAIWAERNFTYHVDTTAPTFDVINVTSTLELGTFQFLYVNITERFIDYVNISINGKNTTLTQNDTQFSYSRFDYANGTVNFTIFALDKNNYLNSTLSSYFVNDSNVTPIIFAINITNTTLPQGNQQTITTTVLDSYPFSTVLLDYNGTNLTMTNTTHYSYNYTWNTTQCGLITYKLYAKTIFNYSTVSNASFTTTNCCGNSLCESGETCSSCSGDCGACSVTPSSSGGGGGGSSTSGGGGSSKPLTSVRFLIGSTSPDEEVKVDVGSSAIPVTTVAIKVKTEIPGVKLTVQALDLKPVLVPEPKRVIQYLEISSQELTPENIEEAVISFIVNATIIGSKNPQEIVLLRYNGSWQELVTSYQGKVGGNYLYKAITPGFSYFAIAFTEEKKQEKELTQPEEYSVNKNESEEIQGPIQITITDDKRPIKYYIYEGIILILIFLLFTHNIIERKLKKLKGSV